MAYAIFSTGGKQYRVSEGDKIEIEKIVGNTGDETTFSNVLLVNTGDSTTVGSPHVSGATVVAEVIDQFRAPKVIAFKYKRRQGYHRTVGHRRLMTRLKIKSINA